MLFFSSDNSSLVIYFKNYSILNQYLPKNEKRREERKKKKRREKRRWEKKAQEFQRSVFDFTTGIWEQRKTEKAPLIRTLKYY